MIKNQDWIFGLFFVSRVVIITKHSQLEPPRQKPRPAFRSFFSGLVKSLEKFPEVNYSHRLLRHTLKRLSEMLLAEGQLALRPDFGVLQEKKR
jgi:hypothetical protein